MKKGEVLEGTVERVDFPNKGMVSCEGGWCVVKNALPGQKISYRVSKVRKGKAEGRLLEVLEKSPWEVESPCPHFGICGGCTYISLPFRLRAAVGYQGQAGKKTAGSGVGKAGNAIYL